MALFLASLVAFGLAVLGLSLGVILGRPALRGSCGGACLHCTSGCAGKARAVDGEETR